ncbi:15372_t:CDS:2 [Acaulospora colombiana]|uniref:15372_t:CDS:1 n=1 Tax=Acaulospora colombiana TaxID=27376 RepID=A0ACA9KAP7_9GLOM|nr:15372_t:CDS:2 [Acaulospora colombiana]
MNTRRLLRSNNATTHPNYNKQVLAKGQTGPRATTRHTKEEKKLSSTKKTASPVEENPAETEHTTSQTQQQRARTNNLGPSSWSDSFEEEAIPANSKTGTVDIHGMEMERRAHLHTSQIITDLMDSDTEMGLKEENETS